MRKRLLIRATGRVSGTIRYGQIEIECGGQISGDVQANAGDDLLSKIRKPRRDLSASVAEYPRRR